MPQTFRLSTGFFPGANPARVSILGLPQKQLRKEKGWLVSPGRLTPKSSSIK